MYMVEIHDHLRMIYVYNVKFSSRPCERSGRYHSLQKDCSTYNKKFSDNLEILCSIFVGKLGDI